MLYIYIYPFTLAVFRHLLHTDGDTIFKVFYFSMYNFTMLKILGESINIKLLYVSGSVYFQPFNSEH